MASDLLRVPPDLRLSDWADQDFYLSKESSGTEGSWKTLPYQTAPMNVIGGDYVNTISWQKSSRVGYTKILVAAICFFAAYKRRSGAIWQPTETDALEFKKDEISPAMRDVPTFKAAMLSDPEKRSKHNTEDRIGFTGATWYMRGGKAARNYRRITLDVALYDELAGFDPDIEGEGWAPSIGDVRLTASAFPKSVRGSTPKTWGECQIERSMAQAGMVFYRNLPCPHCSEFHPLEWKNFTYDREAPEKTALFGCPHCGGTYGYDQYAEMDAAGRWMCGDLWIHEESETVLDAEGNPVDWPSHVGFFIWAGYSYMQSWGRLARLWADANDEKKRSGDTTLLKTFINTQLAETWREEETGVDADSLQARREEYVAPVPMGVVALTGGIDTQDDRLEFEVVGHGPDGETWGIEHGVLFGDPADADVWEQLDRLRGQTWKHETGSAMRVLAWGIDSGGHRTKQVYEYCRTRHGERVYCLKGQGGEGVPVTRTPSKIKVRGIRTVKLYNIGVDSLKAWWNSALQRGDTQAGYQHIPATYSDEWCEQATGEVFVRKFEKGKVRRFWRALRSRVEGLDCRVYAMAAFHILNPRLDLMRPDPDSRAVEVAPEKPNPRPQRQRRAGNYVSRY